VSDCCGCWEAEETPARALGTASRHASAALETLDRLTLSSAGTFATVASVNHLSDVAIGLIA
jgi:hypothetical protein